MIKDINICSRPGCNEKSILQDHLCHKHWLKRVLFDIGNVLKYVDNYENAEEQNQAQYDILERAMEKEFERGVIAGMNEFKQETQEIINKYKIKEQPLCEQNILLERIKANL